MMKSKEFWCWCITLIMGILFITGLIFYIQPKHTIEPVVEDEDLPTEVQPQNNIVRTVWEDASNEYDIYKIQLNAELENKEYEVPEEIHYKVKYAWNGRKISRRGGLIQYKDSLFLCCSPKDYVEYVFKDNKVQAICDGIVYNFKVKEYKDDKFWLFDKMYVIPKDMQGTIASSKNVIINPDTELQREITFIN